MLQVHGRKSSALVILYGMSRAVSGPGSGAGPDVVS